MHIACWDSMSSFPVCDWVIACLDSMSMTHAILYPNPQLVDNAFGVFNPINVNFLA